MKTATEVIYSEVKGCWNCGKKNVNLTVVIVYKRLLSVLCDKCRRAHRE